MLLALAVAVTDLPEEEGDVAA